MIDITKRRILLLAVVSIGLITASAGTYAYLSDSDETAMNFESGSLVIETTETLDYGVINENAVEKTQAIENNGTLPARQIHWRSTSLDGSDSLLSAMQILSVEYGGEEVRRDMLDEMGSYGVYENDIFDLNDVHQWLADGNRYPLEEMSGGDGIESGDTKGLTIRVQIDYGQPGVNGNGSYAFTMTSDIIGLQEPAEGEIPQETPVPDTESPTPTETPTTTAEPTEEPTTTP